MKYILLIAIIFLISGCNDNTKKTNSNLDGKTLLNQKCSKCHNIDFPPKNFTNEVAPPMMTIAFHFHDWFKANTSTDQLAKQLNFVKDYIINPSANKAYCTKPMLKKYGLMPSQKNNVTKDEIDIIWRYIFTNFTQKKLIKKQKALQKLHSLPLGEQLIIKYHCNSCHKTNKTLVGPSFRDISLKYKLKQNHIINSIQNGSKNIWKNSKGAMMPPFKNISQNDLNAISKWIINLN